MPGMVWQVIAVNISIDDNSSFTVDNGNIVYKIVAVEASNDATFTNWTRNETRDGNRHLCLE